MDLKSLIASYFSVFFCLFGVFFFLVDFVRSKTCLLQLLSLYSNPRFFKVHDFPAREGGTLASADRTAFFFSETNKGAISTPLSQRHPPFVPLDLIIYLTILELLPSKCDTDL